MKRTLASAGTVLAAVLLPKCPLCIAGWLSVIGIGTGVAGVIVVVLRPTLWGIAAVLAALAVLRWVHRPRASC